MGRFSDAARETAENMERIANAMESIPQGGSFAAPTGGGGGGGGSAIPPTIFNTTVRVEGGIPFGQRTTSSPIGSQGGDLQSRAFAFFGLSAANRSAAFIKQIVDEFLRRMKNEPNMGLRMGSNG